ncbi:MAG: HPr family phosphocarrier protein [Candidatus Omnitrophica bacterium]|nr:HPr family phosphocarrier protein [Candidatus Omnitrophota bacterium]
MSLVRRTITVKNKQGLHARPAALFVQIANKFDANITVIRDNERVNGKSIMGILMLGAEKDSAIEIEADGHDAESAIAELEQLVASEE